MFAAAAGILLALALFKFGNPVVMRQHITLPSNGYEWILSAWPLELGFALAALVLLSGLCVVRYPPHLPRWVAFAPLPWLIWQVVSATGTLDASVTGPTLIQFTLNTAWFYAGLFMLGSIRNLTTFWLALLAGFFGVLLIGWQQHFGGLEATRDMFWSEIYPHLAAPAPEEWIRRMSSDRIFATLFYPNTLAGALLLLTPACAGAVLLHMAPGPPRRIVLALMTILAAGCLYWSGSKAGWLLALALALLVLWRLRFPLRAKLALLLLVLAGGSAGFVWKYSDYLRQGATSAVARFDYWQAALKTASTHPLRGTGPGTFGQVYAEIKPPEAEMAHLVHNDFLQQASDSGWPGVVGFAGFLLACLVRIARRVWPATAGPLFWIWLGVTAITLQSLVEFGLYIPAISWPAMALLGWLLAATNHLDKTESAHLPSLAK